MQLLCRLQLQLRFSPWLGNFHMPWVWQKKKKKERERKTLNLPHDTQSERASYTQIRSYLSGKVGPCIRGHSLGLQGSSYLA